MKNMMNKLFMPLIVGVVALSALQHHAVADENAALYGDAIPEDAAFVRIANVSDQPATFIVDGKTQSVGGRQMGGYLILKEGDYPVEVNGLKESLMLKPKSGITLSYDGKSLVPLVDALPEDTRKSQVMFYNFSQQPLALKTGDGKYVIIDAVAPGQSGVRAVNEVKMPFSAYAGDQPVANYEPILLRKGQTYSYVIMQGDAGELTAQAKANTVDVSVN
ncbi:alginate O-acetyltransferase AlgF [Gilvimarinus agarilyticus]|uniref:alginate O-acetyltransferase AlgF n=1 Tax=Gilvimarinus agarilyticus TaxID=679259 RepID=UPI0005A076FD|nr:alginate O-acetyltransferase AlgF [Gilvimarinus agarilyticus]